MTTMWKTTPWDTEPTPVHVVKASQWQLTLESGRKVNTLVSRTQFHATEWDAWRHIAEQLTDRLRKANAEAAEAKAALLDFYDRHPEAKTSVPPRSESGGKER